MLYGGIIMKFTTKLKEKLNSAASEEEKKKIIEQIKTDAEEAGIVLDDAELDSVAAGIGVRRPDKNRCDGEMY